MGLRTLDCLIFPSIRAGSVPLTAKQRAALVSHICPRNQALCSEMKKYQLLILSSTNYTQNYARI